MRALGHQVIRITSAMLALGSRLIYVDFHYFAASAPGVDKMSSGSPEFSAHSSRSQQHDVSQYFLVSAPAVDKISPRKLDFIVFWLLSAPEGDKMMSRANLALAVATSASACLQKSTK